MLMVPVAKYSEKISGCPDKHANKCTVKKNFLHWPFTQRYYPRTTLVQKKEAAICKGTANQCRASDTMSSRWPTHLKNPTSRMHLCTEQLALEMIQVYVQQKRKRQSSGKRETPPDTHHARLKYT